MEGRKTLMLDLVKPLMEPSYMLIWTDYNDNLGNHLGIIRKCLGRRNCDCLWERAGGWYGDMEYEAVHGVTEKLKEECLVFNDFDEHEVDALFSERGGATRGEIYNRNDSDVVEDLVRYTGDVPVWMEMPSDYDCINSNWFESQGGYSYEESYLGSIADGLGLNPVQVKKLLMSHGYKVYGRFPNRKSRNGKEQVSYEQFYEKLINFCCGVSLLTYIGKVSLKESHDADFSLKEVIIPKGNCCGLFSSTYGGESLLEMELKQNVKFRLEVKGCNSLRFRLDDERFKYDYSIQHVYDVDDLFLSSPVSIVP